MNPDNEVHLDRIIDYFLDEISNFYPAAPYIIPVSQSKNKHINFIFLKKHGYFTTSREQYLHKIVQKSTDDAYSRNSNDFLKKILPNSDSS